MTKASEQLAILCISKRKYLAILQNKLVLITSLLAAVEG